MASHGVIPEQAGGLPVLSVIGTPRAMGGVIGERLKSRLQMAAQLLIERHAQVTDGRLDAQPLRARLQPGLQAMSQHQPTLRMEFDAIAAGAEIDLSDALMVHCGSAVSAACATTPTADHSACISLCPRHTKNGTAALLFAWQIDPVLLSALTVVRRLPAHAPASLTLTLGGLHVLAGVTEAGLAVAANPLSAVDCGSGLPIGHLAYAALSAPVLPDAAARLGAAPRMCGAAYHLLAADDVRMSIETSGTRTVRLEDTRPEVPRVHSAHALANELHELCSATEASRSELKRLAALTGHAIALSPSELAGWFGLGPHGSPVSGWDPARTVVCVIEPAHKRIHLVRGAASVAVINL